MVKLHSDTGLSTIFIDQTEILGIDPDANPFPKPTRGTKSVTTFKDTWQKKGLKMPDAGKSSFSGIRIPGDPGQIALYAASSDGKEHVITVTVPDAGEVWQYNAFVSTDFPENKDETYRFTCDLEVQGAPVLTTTFATITTIVTTSGVMYPTAGIPAGSGGRMVSYLASGTTVTLTVTAAAASYLGYSLDGGTTWTALTSAVASGSITMGAAGTTKDVVIMVSESAKATRFVNLSIVRVA
jgi:hypothetical protein